MGDKVSISPFPHALMAALHVIISIAMLLRSMLPKISSARARSPSLSQALTAALNATVSIFMLLRAIPFKHQAYVNQHLYSMWFKLSWQAFISIYLCSIRMESLRSRPRQQSYVLPLGWTQLHCTAPLLAAQVLTFSCSPSHAARRHALHFISGYHQPQLQADSRHVHLWNEVMSDIPNFECHRSRRWTIHVH